MVVYGIRRNKSLRIWYNIGMKLTPKQKKFCDEYLIDLNATQSAIRAGYSEKTAYSQGQRLLKNVEIQEYIRELNHERQERTKITGDMVVAELALLAFSDTGNLFTEDGGLKHISSMPEEVTRTIQEVTSRFERARGSDDGEVAEIVKIKTYDKKGALDSLGKHFGIFEKDNAQAKTESNVNNQWTIEFIEAKNEQSSDTE